MDCRRYHVMQRWSVVDSTSVLMRASKPALLLLVCCGVGCSACDFGEDSSESESGDAGSITASLFVAPTPAVERKGSACEESGETSCTSNSTEDENSDDESEDIFTFDTLIPAAILTPLIVHQSAKRTPKSPHSSGKGKYSREGGKGKREKWNDGPDSHCQRYLSAIKNGNFFAGVHCTCCTSSRANTPCWENLPYPQRLLKKCAEQCYGESMLLTGEPTLSNHNARQKWFELVHAHRVIDAATGNVTSIDYKLGGVKVCATVFYAVYGATAAAATSIDQLVRAGANAYKVTDRNSSNPKAEETCSMFGQAVTWWLDLFRCFDNTTKHGELCYDVRNWTDTYRYEFIPTMHQLGFKWHLPLVLAPDERDEHDEEEEDDGGSKGTWYRARKVALKRYAEETYDEVGCECYMLKSRRKLCVFAHSSPEKTIALYG